ncbi:MAG: hypothetical protein JO131_10240, partial [Gammaproteobacteria bacterium]|nr:hypothetical protein [Gammaproteobacteria bacterium]
MTAEKMERVYYEFNNIFNVRWIASEQNALYRIHKSYPQLMEDLSELIKESSTNAHTKHEAQGLFSYLANCSFLAFFYFIYDTINDLTNLSEQLQNSLGVAAGKAQLINQFISLLENKKTTFGSHEIVFLAQAFCKKPEYEATSQEEGTSLAEYIDTYFLPCSTWETFLNSKIVILYRDGWSYPLDSLEQSSRRHHQGIFDRTYPALTQICESLLTLLIQEIQNYFPEGELELFDIFLPNALPENVFAASTYKNAEVSSLARKLGIDTGRAVLGWQNLLKSMINGPKLNLWKNSDVIQ